jgi:hypothetical protein
MAELTPPAWVEQGNNHARSARLLATATVTGGIWNPGDLVVTNPSGVNLSVAAGGCYVSATSAGNGAFACYNDAGVTLSVPSAPAFNQVSIVVAQVEAQEFGDGTDRWYLRVVSGGSGGAVPAPPSNALLLAQATVNSGSTTVTSLVDKRTYAANRANHVATHATRGSGYRPGHQVWETDTQLPHVYDGTNWRRIVTSADAVTYSATRMCAGQASLAFTASNTATANVTFPAGMFSAPPHVTTGIITSAGPAIGSTVLVYNRLNTGCTIQLKLLSSTTATYAVDWIAVGSD